MSATTEGRIMQSGVRKTLRNAIPWTLLALGLLGGVGLLKSVGMRSFAVQAAGSVEARQTSIANLFQASFYFFYDDQFLPGVREQIVASRKESEAPIRSLRVVTQNGDLVFDSDAPTAAPGSGTNVGLKAEPEVLEALKAGARRAWVRGFDLYVLVPGDSFAIVYRFTASTVRNQVIGLLCAGFLLWGVALWLVSQRLAFVGLRRLRAWSRRWLGLRFQFLAAIVFVNLATAGLIFWSLSTLQTREQTQRIERDSLLFSQFSTSQIVSDFTNYFYFNYPDRFLPSVKRIVAANENLLKVRIISYRTSAVLFDSDRDASASGPPQSKDVQIQNLSHDLESSLKDRDWALERSHERSGDARLTVVTTYRNEDQDPLFRVEYVFGYTTLEKALAAIRSRILADLLPSMALSLIVSIIFAQLLIRPIRRLMTALQKVSSGDYDVSVKTSRNDEIGELVGAFNAMTSELKKKQELRKYLSESTYRQIMQAADKPGDSPGVGGRRINATILFTDIRGFVNHCENAEAEEITSMLNDYFSVMVEVVRKHGGDVDKFIGDALLAVFYANEVSPEASALSAITCALEMREKLDQFNLRRRGAQKATIEIGAGISHGEIIWGPIGSKDRRDFTVIGDVVNLANRIEKLSKQGRHTKIVFANRVEELVRGLLNYEELTVDKIRGKEEEVKVYELIGVRDLGLLIAEMSASEAIARRRAVELLGQSRNKEALAPVLRALSDADETVRIRAAFALTRLATKDQSDVLDVLFERLDLERSPKVIASLVMAVGKLCTTERALSLARFLEGGDARIIANTVEAIGQVRTPKGSDLVLPLLSHRNNRVKANVALALFSAGHIDVIESLKPMLMHSEPAMRSSAAFAIGELTQLTSRDDLGRVWGDSPTSMKMFLGELQACVPMLVTLLKDPDPQVRRQAIVALGKTRDRSAVLPLIDSLEVQEGTSELALDVQEALRAIGSHQLVREVIARLAKR